MAICGNLETKSESPGMAVEARGIKSANISPESFDFTEGFKFPLLGKSTYSNRELSEGAYTTNAIVEVGNTEPITLNNFVREFEYQGKLKKVRFKRVNISEPEPVDGKMLSRVTAVFKIDENPLPIGLIIWGAVASTGLTAGGYFVNSINRFTESGFNQILALAGVGTSLYLAFFRK